MNKLITLLILLTATQAWALKVGVVDDFRFYHGNEIVDIIQKNSTKNIQIVKFQLDENATQETYHAILEKVAKAQLDILNLSFGTKEYDPKEHTLLRKISNLGTKIVVAAGNSNSDVSRHDPVYPCLSKVENLYCIGALDKRSKSKFSNYGRYIDFFIDGSFSKGNMTSFAAPRFVAVLSHLIMGNVDIDSYLNYSYKVIPFPDLKAEFLRAIDVKVIKKEMNYHQKALLVSKRNNPI